MNDGQWRAMETWSIKGMPVWGTSVGITIDIWGAHWTRVSRIAVRFFTIWATRKAGRICQYLSEEPPSWTFWILCVCVILQVLWKSSEACWLLLFFSAPSHPLDWDCKVCFVLSSPHPSTMGCSVRTVLSFLYATQGLISALCFASYGSVLRDFATCATLECTSKMSPRHMLVHTQK